MQCLMLCGYGLYIVGFQSTKATYATTEYEQIWEKVAGDAESASASDTRRMLELLDNTEKSYSDEDIQRRYQTHIHRDDFLDLEKPKLPEEVMHKIEIGDTFEERHKAQTRYGM